MTSREELEDRLKKFSLRVLNLVRNLPKSSENKIYGNQVIRSSSSVGANYSEALCAHTKKDFVHDLNKCRKEIKETIYWLELISGANPSIKKRMNGLLRESQEIFKIFTSSVKTIKVGKNNKS